MQNLTLTGLENVSVSLFSKYVIRYAYANSGNGLQISKTGVKSEEYEIHIFYIHSLV